MSASGILVVLLVISVTADNELQWRKECGIEDLEPHPTIEQRRAVDPCKYECFMNKTGFMKGGKVDFEKLRAGDRSKDHEILNVVEKKFAESTYSGSSPCTESARLLAVMLAMEEDHINAGK